ncbi:unnamed protein product [Prorocentrum cordatum]|uniref:Rubredoxin-like domain-containing protein n=1 Tax=Prorocentrum cordatum TaxID=2364126 RepID=A0ABN9TTG9_9DINO|nr:unnamed protein product [Polarella glacialis]
MSRPVFCTLIRSCFDLFGSMRAACGGAAAQFLLGNTVAFVAGRQAVFNTNISPGGVEPARGELVARQARGGAGTYWEGEWICADCGYIYNERAFGSKFEDLKMGFKCPACAAPRRRFARKLGDKVGTTLDGGDTPIIIFSVVALVAVFAIAYWTLN